MSTAQSINPIATILSDAFPTLAPAFEFVPQDHTEAILAANNPPAVAVQLPAEAPQRGIILSNLQARIASIVADAFPALVPPSREAQQRDALARLQAIRGGNCFVESNLCIGKFGGHKEGFYLWSVDDRGYDPQIIGSSDQSWDAAFADMDSKAGVTR